ncbi:MAG: ABC transporter permease [Saprospiraceae bacterium]|nr:ABC transporter permease [Saprospiraceae bacterium]
MGKKRFRSVIRVLGFFLVLALLRDVLANGRPLYCRIGGEAYFPGLRSIWADKDLPYSAPALRRIQQLPQTFEAWKDEKNYDESPVFALIPFSPGEYSRQNPASFLHPGQIHPGMSSRFRHWLGTDEGGHDVAAGIVSGARIALMVSLLSMGIAGILGVLLGALAGFWGDYRLRIPWLTLSCTIISIPIAYFYAVIARQYELENAASVSEWGKSLLIFVLIMLGVRQASKFADKWLQTSLVTVPIDLLLMRLTEIFNAVPKLIFILIVAALLPYNQNIWVLIALIGLLNWTDIALFVRSELLRVRELDYVTAARAMGFSDRRTFWRHAFPNALRPALVIFAFNMANAILLEAALSFLGFGGNTLRGISWGSLLESVRVQPGAWWVGIPSGLAIALTVMTINNLGELLASKPARSTT